MTYGTHELWLCAIAVLTAMAMCMCVLTWFQSFPTISSHTKGQSPVDLNKHVLEQKVKTGGPRTGGRPRCEMTAAATPPPCHKTKHLRYKEWEEVRTFPTHELGWPRLQTRTYSISPYIVSDSSTIVFRARQLYTHSRNVSLLCFLYTKGGLWLPLGKYSP